MESLSYFWANYDCPLSGAGKTQYLLSLLLSAQMPAPQGLFRPTLYISTEGALATNRLTEILSNHPLLCTQESPPSLSKVLSIQTPDLESQEHIITYQLPVVIERENIGLVIIDSIAANYRAERSDSATGSALAERSNQLARLGAQLRGLALAHNCAIVVANQVSDRFVPISSIASHPAAKSVIVSAPYPPSSSAPCQQSHVFNPLNLDHQLRFFSGWGSDPNSGVHSLKNPSLGLVWANQIACRIVLIKESCYKLSNPEGMFSATGGDKSVDWGFQTWRRFMKVAFAAWVESTCDAGQGVEFEIWSGGLRAVEARATDADLHGPV